MKKIALALLLLLSVGGLSAQIISPYYPAPPIGTKITEWETQMSYVELNYVASKVDYFMRISRVAQQADVTDKLNNGTGTITYKYVESVAANRAPFSLTVVYNVFALDHALIIKSVRITGNYALDFYARFWHTSLNFAEPQKDAIVSNNYLQDKVTCGYNNGFWITITNSTIKSVGEFAVLVNELKAKHAIDIESENKAKEEQEKLKKEDEERQTQAAIVLAADKKKKADEEAAKQDSLQHTKRLDFTIQLNYTKKGIKILQNNSEMEIESLTTDLEKYIKDKPFGRYVLTAEYVISYGKTAKYSMSKLAYFEKILKK